MDGKLPNVTLFLVMAFVFMFLAYANRARLSADTGSDGLNIIINLVIVFSVMVFGGFVYHFNLKKKAQLNTK